MRRHILWKTGIEVSQLGFGCVKLTTHRERRDAIRILEDTFTHGITHFDVARAYGFGRAEGILGEFLRDKRGRVTVATKVGIQPPSGIAGNRLMIDLAKKILSPFPRMLQRMKQHGSALVKSAVFTPTMVVQSLETSLRELHTDYIDLLLLHEATLAQATSLPLIECLQQQVARGTVRSFGVAAALDKLGQGARGVPAEYAVLQFEDNAHARNLRMVSRGTDRALITHGIFHPASSLKSAIAERPDLAQKFSAEINADLQDSSVVGSLLLHYALQSNSDGVVLFSSCDRLRVSANVQESDSGRYDEQQLSKFVEFVDAALTRATLSKWTGTYPRRSGHDS